jgi:hypothetical protein
MYTKLQSENLKGRNSLKGLGAHEILKKYNKLDMRIYKAWHGRIL